MSYKFAVLLKPGDEQPALDRAAQYAAVSKEKIEIVAVRVFNDYAEGHESDLIAKENAKLEHLRRRYASLENMTIKTVFNKDIADGFVSVCNEGCSMAIISANKRHAIRDLFVSTIDSNVMRKSTVPLLVVKSANDTAQLGQNVVLAIDFGEVSHLDKLDDYLFEAASRFAATFDGVVHVANCLAPRVQSYMGAEVGTSKLLLGDKSQDDLDIRYQLAKEYAEKHNIPKENMHVIEGRPDEAIPRLSFELNARMICMGASKRSTFFGTVNSSASELVLEQISGDIFIVNIESLK